MKFFNCSCLLIYWKKRKVKLNLYNLQLIIIFKTVLFFFSAFIIKYNLLKYLFISEYIIIYFWNPSYIFISELHYYRNLYISLFYISLRILFKIFLSLQFLKQLKHAMYRSIKWIIISTLLYVINIYTYIVFLNIMNTIYFYITCVGCLIISVSPAVDRL